MKHFVTLFPPAENVHLIKDVGQIPYYMQQTFGYEATLVCYKNEASYDYLHNEVQGLNLEFIDDHGLTFFWEKEALRFIYENAGAIDVLNLYHLTQASMLYGMVYKYLNPEGTLFLKMDFNQRRFKNRGLTFSDSSPKEWIYQQVLKSFLSKTDILSAETEEAKRILENELNRDVLYLPNGAALHEECITSPPSTSTKENIILTVGRIGIPEKNHELLLKALSKASLADWKVYVVGPIEKKFEALIKDFYERNPFLSNQVVFTGEICNRDTLYEYYRRAKIFCMPSRSEGSPLALVEALCFGNYIVGTDAISSIGQITRNGELGHVVPSEDADVLRQALEDVTQNNFYTEEKKSKIIAHSQKFRWPVILERLNDQLQKMEGE